MSHQDILAVENVQFHPVQTYSMFLALRAATETRPSRVR